MLSRLKGIETMYYFRHFITLSLSLDMLSRLKGIETGVHPYRVRCRLSLDMVSRLKGIETNIPIHDQSTPVPLWICFPV